MHLKQLNIAQTRSITVTASESSKRIGGWNNQNDYAVHSALPIRQEDYEAPAYNDNLKKNSNFPELFDLYLSPDYERIIVARTKIRHHFKSVEVQEKLNNKARYEKAVETYNR